MAQSDPITMTPPEYLEFVVARARDNELGRFKDTDSESGLRTECVNGISYAYIEDEKRYRHFLQTSRHLTPGEVDQILAKDQEVEKYFLDGVAAFKSRLHNASDFAKRLLQDKAVKLTDVPLGFAPLSYLYGGAMPVPAGGNIVVISGSFSNLLYWMTWISLLHELAGSDIGHLRRLWSSLPDLARHIVGDSPAMGEFMYFVCFAAGADIFKSGKTNRLCWLAEVFLVLHEYAHILKGHTNVMRQWPSENLLSEGELLERRAFQRNLEFEADALAADALKRVVYTDSLDPGSVVDEVLDALNRLFLLFHFAESEAHLSQDQSTHPPAVERWKCALATYLNDTPTTEAQINDIVHVNLAYYYGAKEIKLQDQ